jgi:fumarate hydratase class II
MMPVIAYNLLQEIEILSASMDAFRTRCVEGIEADESICREYAERSPALATALSPEIGYQKAAEVAKEALERGALMRDLVLEKGLLDKKKAEELLDLRRLTEPPTE